MFNLITTTAGTYTLDIPGNYNKTGAAFAAPYDHFRLTGGSVTRGEIRAKVVRQKFVDVQVPGAAVGVTKRVAARIGLDISVPSSGGFTPAEVAALVSELQQFLVAANIDRLLKGEI